MVILNPIPACRATHHTDSDHFYCPFLASCIKLDLEDFPYQTILIDVRRLMSIEV